MPDSAGTFVAETARILDSFGVSRHLYDDGGLEVHSPISGEVIGRVHRTHPAESRRIIEKAHEAFLVWRETPPPRRGELVRLFGEELRAAKPQLGRLVTIETGKILAEGRVRYRR